MQTDATLPQSTTAAININRSQHPSMSGSTSTGGPKPARREVPPVAPIPEASSLSSSVLKQPGRTLRQQNCDDGVSNHKGNSTTDTTPTARHPLSWLIFECIWPGLGLLGESYLLFSIGTLKPIWHLIYHDDCWTATSGDSSSSENENENQINCNGDALLAPLSYAVVVGVISGMLVLGVASGHLGRRTGSLLTASFMTVGATGLLLGTIFLSDHPIALFRTLTLCVVILGFGVGGEYPLSAASASEKSMACNRTPHDNDGLMKRDTGSFSPSSRGRGREVQLVFTMQGVGIFLHTVILTLLLFVFRQGSWVIQDTSSESDSSTDYYDAGYNYEGQVADGEPAGLSKHGRASLLAIWRLVYAVGVCILVTVLYTRYFYLEESSVWKEDADVRERLERSKTGFPQLPVSPSDSNRDPREIKAQPSVTSSDPISLVSSVSSLSAPSVAILPIASYDYQDTNLGLNEHWISSIPSTDPRDDMNASTWKLLQQNYGVRLGGVSLCWFLWDIAFYGNKLFQSSFILALTGAETTLIEFAMAASLNAFVALVGYISAALVMDRIGRRSLQQWGFLLTGALFVGCGFLYQHLSTSALVAMYFGSSFFGQLGPNATTFLIPAEAFPTQVRTTCHGIAAASGKLGALFAAVVFSYVQELDMFLLSGYASFAACAVTFWTIPESQGLDLDELDKKWRLIQAGRKAEYRGPANHPQFLSYYEKHRRNFSQQQDTPLRSEDVYAMLD